ncbi:MAG: hypothetical protein ACXAB7_13210 [Candidatus Kariarchaeaceae archaeon]|jgi:hypothetical protein
MGGINPKVLPREYRKIHTIIIGVGVFFFILSLFGSHYVYHYTYSNLGEPFIEQKSNINLRDNHASLANIIELYTVIIIVLCSFALVLVLLAQSYDLAIYNWINSAVLVLGSSIVVLLLLNFSETKEEYGVRGPEPLNLGGTTTSLTYGTSPVFVVIGLIAVGIARLYLWSKSENVISVKPYSLHPKLVHTHRYQKMGNIIEILLSGIIIIITVVLVPKQYLSW